MIIVRLNGGLGNQMFQFAAAQAQALRLNTDLMLDCRAFLQKKDGLTPRNFELGIFKNSKFEILDKSIASKYLREEMSNTQKLLSKITGRNLFKYYRQPNFFFNESFWELSIRTYLIGYFQSEKYFAKYANEIRESFSFPEEISEKNKEIKSSILESNSISVHIRRGDYVNTYNINHHGICSKSYYHSAIELMKKKVNNPIFFFFSDDIAWVKEHIKTEATNHYISHNKGKNSFEDLRLMSLCKHNIIANSSFSWWGAWLNENENRIIVAPTPWFSDSKKEKESFDIVPKEWVKLIR